MRGGGKDSACFNKRGKKVYKNKRGGQIPERLEHGTDPGRRHESYSSFCSDFKAESPGFGRGTRPGGSPPPAYPSSASRARSFRKNVCVSVERRDASGHSLLDLPWLRSTPRCGRRRGRGRAKGRGHTWPLTSGGVIWPVGSLSFPVGRGPLGCC